MLEKPLLPHQKLRAFGVAKDLLIAVRDAGIGDTHLRDQAMRAASERVLERGRRGCASHPCRQGPRVRHRKGRSGGSGSGR